MSDRNVGLDIAANRGSPKYTTGELARRWLWSLARPLFRLSPRWLFSWRRALLRLFGATVGEHVHVYPTATIFIPWNLTIGDWSSVGDDALVYNLGPVTIGTRVTISHRAHLCAGTHDHRRPDMPLLKPPIRVGDDAWICAQAFVGPNVSIGAGAVVAAAAVVVRDVDPWQVVAGNPARPVGVREIAIAPTVPPGCGPAEGART
jgi:putative colanic acid biosynthesis acetyltransferase WcaF